MKTISDEKLKAYFLGGLPEPEAEIFEIECASNTEIYQRAQVVESELTDDYLRGNLSADEVRLYETNYLITEARHQKLAIAAGLWELANKQTPVALPVDSASSPLWQMFSGKRRFFQFAFGGAVLMIVFCAAAFYLLNSSVTEREVAEVKEPTPKIETPAIQNPDSRPVQNSGAVNQNPKSVSNAPVVENKVTDKEILSPPKNLPDIKNTQSPRTAEPNKAAFLMTVKLLPGTLRGEDEQSLTIAPNVKNLKLLLSPVGEPNNYKIYRAVLKTPENQTIFTSSDLKALSFTIPAGSLENRTYIIFLEGKNAKNEFESIGEYTFRVRR